MSRLINFRFTVVSQHENAVSAMNKAAQIAAASDEYVQVTDPLSGSFFQVGPKGEFLWSDKNKTCEAPDVGEAP